MHHFRSKDSVSGTICFQGLSRLSLKLERMIMSEAVERISQSGFESFSVDVATCESMGRNGLAIASLQLREPSQASWYQVFPFPPSRPPIAEFLNSCLSSSSLSTVPGANMVFRKLREVRAIKCRPCMLCCTPAVIQQNHSPLSPLTGTRPLLDQVMERVCWWTLKSFLQVPFYQPPNGARPPFQVSNVL